MSKKAKKAERTLPEMYFDIVAGMIDEAGVYPHQGIWKGADGKLSLMSMDLHPNQAAEMVLRLVKSRKAVEAIFGLDRTAMPDQGTTLGDLVAGVHFVGGERRPFVIEYQHAPRIVKPIDFGNDIWNAMLLREVRGFLG